MDREQVGSRTVWDGDQDRIGSPSTGEPTLPESSAPAAGGGTPARHPPDIVLGGPTVEAIRDWPGSGNWLRSISPERPLWDNVHRSPLGWAVRAKANAASHSSGSRCDCRGGDSRNDRPGRRSTTQARPRCGSAWAKREAQNRILGRGYARLVRDVGHSRADRPAGRLNAGGRRTGRGRGDTGDRP